MDQMQPIDMEYKPWGGLAGAYSGIQSSQIDQSNQNRLAMQGLENTIKGVQAGRDLADYSNPEYEKWRQAGDIGKNQTLAASGKYDQSVLDSKIDRGIAENFAGKSKAQVEQGIAEDTQLLRELRSLYSMGEQTQFGNQWLYSGKQYAAQKGFPQEAIEPFVKDPSKLKLVIDHLESALARTPAVLGKMAEDKNKHVYTMEEKGFEKAMDYRKDEMKEQHHDSRQRMQTETTKENTLELRKIRAQEAATHAAVEIDKENIAIDNRLKELYREEQEAIIMAKGGTKDEKERNKQLLKKQYTAQKDLLESQKKLNNIRKEQLRNKTSDVPVISNSQQDPVPDIPPAGAVRERK